MKYAILLSLVVLTLDFVGVETSGRPRPKNNLDDVQSLFTCPVMANATELVPLQDCGFQDHGNNAQKLHKLLCNVTLHVTNVDDEIVEYRNFLRVSVSLEMLEDLGNNTDCIGMTAIQISKVDHIEESDCNVYKVGDLDSVGLLIGIAQLQATVRFPHPVPVGLAEDCSRQRLLSCEPKVRVTPLLAATSVDMKDKIHIAHYVFLNLLQGQVVNLSVTFNELGEFTTKWTLPYLQGTGLQYLELIRGRMRHNLSLPPQPLLLGLNLTHCNIEFISDEFFYNTPNLQYLNLAENKLNRIPDGISLLTNLQELDLSSNPLVISTDSCFTFPLHQLHNLQVLRLSHVTMNNLDILRPLLFASVVKLTELHLVSCNISTINSNDISIFKYQTSLRLLDLSNNKLQYIPTNLIQALQNLSIFNLSSNYFYKGPQLILKVGSTLNILDLSYNYLTLPVNIIQLGTVNLVDLSSNNISSWSDIEILPSSAKINCLNLSHNFMQSISENMINSLKILPCVDLGKNPFHCKNCNIMTLKNWYFQDKTVKILNLNTNRSLSCGGTMYAKNSIDIDFKPEDCYVNTLPVLLIPIAMLISLMLMCGVVAHGYKFQVAYLLHLMKVKFASLTWEPKAFQCDAFVCYSGVDRNWVFRELVPHLENGPEKYKLCLHERDFVLGSFITHNIMNFLQYSRKTIMVLTTNFITSQWCNWELEMAKHKLFEDGEDFLIFINLEHLDILALPRHLRFLMTTQKYIKWPSPLFADDATWRRLKAELGVSLYMKQHNITNNMEETEGRVRRQSVHEAAQHNNITNNI